MHGLSHIWNSHLDFKPSIYSSGNINIGFTVSLTQSHILTNELSDFNDTMKLLNLGKLKMTVYIAWTVMYVDGFKSKWTIQNVRYTS